MIMKDELEERLQREVEHGATAVAITQAEFGWDSPAGKIRRKRRGDFLVHGLTKNMRALEIGAGTGLQTLPIIDAVGHVDAIDISPELLEVAKRKAPGANYFVMDAHVPDFPPGTFDAILGVSILHHLDWELALQNYLPLLKPGGVVRFSEPNLLNPQIFLQKNIPFIKRMAGDSPDEYAFTRGHITRLLKKLGYTRITVRPFEFLHPATPASLLPTVMAIESVVAKTPLNAIAGSLLIEAYKPL